MHTRTTLSLLSTMALLALTGCDAASTLQGAPWTIARWTFTIETNSVGEVTTDEAVAEDAGTLEFTTGPGAGFGDHLLIRTLSSTPVRGSSTPSFGGASSGTSDWSPGGLDSEPDQITIFDTDDLWNHAWTLQGTTLVGSLGVDFGGQQTLNETHRLELSR
jgi:hypothetical protein